MKLPRFEISAFGKLGKAVPALHRSKYAISATVFLPLGIDAVRNNGLQRWPEGGWAEAPRAENQAYGVWAAQDKTKSGQWPSAPLCNAARERRRQITDRMVLSVPWAT